MGFLDDLTGGGGDPAIEVESKAAARRVGRTKDGGAWEITVSRRATIRCSHAKDLERMQGALNRMEGNYIDEIADGFGHMDRAMRGLPEPKLVMRLPRGQDVVEVWEDDQQ